jgi:hypothetical protein
VEQLDSSLVVFSPYNSLMHLLRSSPQIKELSQNAWACLNDVYRTDLPLRYPPHMLAIGCLHLVSVMCNRDIRGWLQSLQVDVNQVRSAAGGPAVQARPRASMPSAAAAPRAAAAAAAATGPARAPRSWAHAGAGAAPPPCPPLPPFPGARLPVPCPPPPAPAPAR